MPHSTVVVAMSGGIDSSCAAAILKEQGYRVIGMTMVPVSRMELVVEQARRVARALGIEHVRVDCTEIFHQRIITPFCDAYRHGMTPNPCIRCNDTIKFGVLLQQAEAYGADFFATGHYARILRASSSLLRLLPGTDPRKDQSYFLYRLDQRRLAKTLMPLGAWRKEDVREYVRRNGLPVALGHESQDVCFLGGKSYGAFLEECLDQHPAAGPILSRDGAVLGEHRGLIYYTIGQRRGIGIAAREPLYVVALDVSRNAVIVGSKKDLYHDRFTVRDVQWISGHAPHEPVVVHTKIRYLHAAARSVITPRDDSRVSVYFDTPQLSITPGQSAVFYDVREGLVLGGGVIETP